MKRKGDHAALMEEFHRIRELRKSEESDRDERVRLVLADESEIRDKYSTIASSRINSEILSYLEGEVRYIPINKKVRIEVSIPPCAEGCQPSADPLEELGTMVRKSVCERLEDLNRELSENMRLCVGLMAAGVVSFLFETFLARRFDSKMLTEMMVIVCWVFVWKAVESYFFERRKMMKEKLKLVQLYLAEYEKAPVVLRSLVLSRSPCLSPKE